jgi:N-acetyl-beta-hexosaminidase
MVGMAMNKLNVLHMHLSDSPCFRVESKTYPQLALKCPMVKGTLNEDGMFYSHEDIAALVAFARARGIRIIPSTFPATPVECVRILRTKAFSAASTRARVGMTIRW